MFNTRGRVTLNCEEGSSLTHQEFRESCNIDTIMRQCMRNGTPLSPLQFSEEIVDYCNVPEFQDAMNAIAVANESFAQLPLKVRKRFVNDPREFLAFCSDPDNAAEMVKLGLAIAKQEPEIIKKTEAPAEAELGST